MPITKQTIDSTRIDVLLSSNAIYLYDDTLRGFGCRVGRPNTKYPAGKITYFVEKRAGGRRSKKFRHVFGEYPTLEPNAARDKALELISKIRSGVDIAADKRAVFQQREQEAQDYRTKQLRVMFDDFVKARGGDSGYWHKDVPSALKTYIYPWFGEKAVVTSITKDNIRGLLKSIDSAPVGIKVTTILRSFFKYLAQEDYITNDPMASLANQHQKGEARNRVLNEQELIAFYRATGDMLNHEQAKVRIFGACFRLLLLTAQRRDDVASMRWSELNLDKAVWEIPAARTKNNHPHMVFLTQESIKIIKSVPQLSKTEFVFTTTGKTAISGFSESRKTLDKYMKLHLGGELAAFHTHDLRASFATTCAGVLKVNDDICDRIINHVNGKRYGVKYVYQKHEYWDERVAALQAWNDYIVRLVAG